MDTESYKWPLADLTWQSYQKAVKSTAYRISGIFTTTMMYSVSIRPLFGLSSRCNDRHLYCRITLWPSYPRFLRLIWLAHGRNPWNRGWTHLECVRQVGRADFTNNNNTNIYFLQPKLNVGERISSWSPLCIPELCMTVLMSFQEIWYDSFSTKQGLRCENLENVPPR